MNDKVGVKATCSGRSSFGYFFDEDEWNKLDWVAGLDSVYLEDCHAASSSIRLLINHLNLQHRATNMNLGREYAEILKWDCKTVKKIALYLP